MQERYRQQKQQCAYQSCSRNTLLSLEPKEAELICKKKEGRARPESVDQAFGDLSAGHRLGTTEPPRNHGEGIKGKPR
jgi:hypothetical protein